MLKSTVLNAQSLFMLGSERIVMFVSFNPFIMKASCSLLLLYLIGCHSHTIELKRDKELNERPIIGVLSQETDIDIGFLKNNYHSYIAASCVKNIEASGARVVPIMIGKNRSYYETLLRKINGVFFPGGDARFDVPNGYADAGQYIYEITKEMNDEGVYFPLFGVCLGFELIVVLATGRKNANILTNCKSTMNLALDLRKDFRESKMFADAPEQIIDTLKYGNNTVNNHGFCFVEKSMKSFNLANDLLATSYGHDNNGLRFISSIEDHRYPIYGTQFHPEKVPYEWISKNFVHSPDAILANRYFMDFFVSESRKNLNCFSSVDEENEYLIYNYSPIFTGKYGGCFEQSYMFGSRGVDSQSQKVDNLGLTRNVQKHC